jgi:glycosyltransferase involved in cell wall biosynthesis
MRILVVTQYFWPENFRINDLVLRLRDRGHSVTVYTGLPNYPSGKIFPGWGPFRRLNEIWEGIPIIRFPHFPRGNRRASGMAANFLSFALFGSLLAPFRVRGDFDIIFVYEPSPITVGLPAITLKRLRGIPIVFWVQDLWPESLTSAGGIKNPWVLKSAETMVRRIYGRCDRILVASRSFVPSVTRHGVPAEKVFYYPQSAESLFRPLEVPPEAPERDELPRGFRILFAGNLGVSQSPGTILEAAELTRSIPNLHWILIGDGRESDRLAREVRKRNLGGTLHLPGRRPLASMPVYYSLADVLLATLKRDPVYSLTVPAKIQSYLACGRPILAALDGEGGRIVEEARAGLAVPAENPEALARAAVQLSESSETERKSMGKRARAYFEANFDPDRLTDQLLDHLALRTPSA